MSVTSLAGTPFALLENPSLIPGFLEDPYPFYERLRSANPIAHMPLPDYEGPGIWLLTSYAATREAFIHPGLSVDNTIGDAFQRYRALLPENFVVPMGPRAMLNLDPPDHTRLRSIVNRTFTPRMVSELKPRVEAIAKELLEDAHRGGSLDLVRDLAEPLPAIVIAEMLGLPAEDREQFRLWTSHIIGLQMHTDPTQAMHSYQALMEYFAVKVAERRARPGSDLLSAMVFAQEEDDALDDEELLTMSMLILAAGHETTTNLIGNGSLALLQHPDQLERLRADRSLLAPGVEEMLRFDTPVHLNVRTAPNDLEVIGEPIPKGATLALLQGAANRDPEVFSEPDRFDVARKENPHLAFGYGRHFCLGAAVARLEAQVAFDVLLSMFAEIHAETLDVERRPNVVLRGPATLPVSVRPS